MIAYFLLFDPFGYAISPVSLVSVSLAAWIYMRGVARSTRLRGTVSIWRQALFFAGLTCILAATNAPLASLGHSLFSAHQVEHLLLRLAGPLLIAVTQPWRLLQAGLNRRWRRYLGALGKSITLRFLAHPVTATAALITSLFIWQIPVLYGLAQRIAAIEVFAHFAMVLAGIWYFGMLFDPRDPPEGARRGARLISGFAVIVSNIFLGSLTTLKEVSLYASYQTAGTGLLDPLSDETMGGYTIWVPSSMLMIAAIILVMNGWNAAEVRRWNSRYELVRGSNSAALEFPETAEELRLKVAKPNRDMGRTLAIGALVMFFIVMTTVVTIVYAL
ncbi:MULTISPECIES: cytochrome c oxidase assembly protein [Roseobacteraceae]|jgi:putative membrane protein|uniref:cytochrome c oxidase assembly protein n=1 Tax=Roseobacteraceae TaxID=2854170 RepID=UPI0009784832|nr:MULTISPECIES: cytochrome c oxidase assembly protein [Roseobacteraceae]